MGVANPRAECARGRGGGIGWELQVGKVKLGKEQGNSMERVEVLIGCGTKTSWCSRLAALY